MNVNDFLVRECVKRLFCFEMGTDDDASAFLRKMRTTMTEYLVFEMYDDTRIHDTIFMRLILHVFILPHAAGHTLERAKSSGASAF